MSPVAQIVIVGIGTYLLRLSFVALAGRIGEIPPRINTVLSMIPPAVLAAITANAIFYADDGFRGVDEWHLTIVVVALISWRTKSVALCLFIGMPVLWTLAALG
ncbi:MAG: AzlD domain-containing protein [Acidimicrobiales bacterium]